MRINRSHATAVVAVVTCASMVALSIINHPPIPSWGAIALYGGSVIHGLTAMASWLGSLPAQIGHLLLTLGMLHLVVFSILVFPSALIAYTLIVLVVYALSFRGGLREPRFMTERRI